MTLQDKAQIAHRLLDGQEGYVGIFFEDEKPCIHVISREFFEEIKEPFEAKGYKVICARKPN
jgi:hypothetical protein